jgi:hypothetical protein
VQKYNATNTWAFHNADDTRQLALRGPDGVLLYMVDVTNPNSGSIPGGQLMEWATFTFDNNVLGVNDGSTLKSRTFAAVGGTGTTYSLALYDGKSTLMRIRLQVNANGEIGVSNTTQTLSALTLNMIRSGST